MAVVLASVAFWAPVVFSLAGDDGVVEQVKFRARYKRLSKTERHALDLRLMAAARPETMTEAMRKRMEDPATKEKERKDLKAKLDAEPATDQDYLDALLVDWELKGKDGERIDYTPTIRAELIDAWDGLEEALVLGHVNAMHATREAVKNSGAPSATR